MSRRLPEFIDPFQLVEKRQELKGTISLSRMQRLAESLAEAGGEAELEIYFGRDEAGLPVARGTLTAKVILQCQRCLEPMEFAIDTEFTLGVVASLNEAGNLPENYEPLIADVVPLSLTELMEDEILLALPTVAVHPEGECAVTHWPAESRRGDLGKRIPETENKSAQKEGDSVYNAASAGQAKETRKNPFAVLEQLKGKLDK